MMMSFLRPSACGSLASLAVVCGCANGSPLDGSGGAGGELTGVTASSSKASTSSHAVSSSASSTASSTVSSTVSTGTGGPMCTDPGPGEPNNTLATAFVLPAISDCDGDAALVKGVLAQGGNDVDWYKYAGGDTSLCVVDPTRQLIGSTIHVCKYVECSNGKTPSFTCPPGTTSDTQGGFPGCCWTGGQSVTLNLTCGSTFLGSDAATIYTRVDHAGGPGCESYQLNYHF